MVEVIRPNAGRANCVQADAVVPEAITAPAGPCLVVAAVSHARRPTALDPAIHDTLVRSRWLELRGGESEHM
jgi:hypothetical protein